ncbi:MAG TPA: hypothetical protein ENJ82_11980 [Bacteroidetes bacterium]|nr:hypothetical protein [Bacteroidota bacterium]
MKDSTISFAQVSIVYSAALPAGDLQKRFGYVNMVGGEAGFKLKNNWMINGGLRFLFGNTIYEKVAQNISVQIGSAETGYSQHAIGSDGRYYELRFYERGIVVPLTIGKIIPIGKKLNPNSGLFVEGGAQFFQHKILMEVIGNNVPFLDKEGRKGYDRLTNGLGAVEGVGYRFFSKHRAINFFIGVEASQNFTRSRRTINYDTGQREDALRFDLQYGLKAGWTFPIYQTAPEDEYFF